ncbi:MAG: helix-turn-helix transcriptional regulator [Eubacteriaceae bacterium]|nr:helix-turn-helix transcriptional regulator [Eubacteriaceae bacterium]
MTSGEMIRDLLKQTGKTQADLARFLKVSPTTVNRWIPTENKKGIEPSKKNIKKIADFFQVSIDVITGDAGEIGSVGWLKFIQDKNKKRESFEFFLESLGYKIKNSGYNKNTNTIDIAKECEIEWYNENDDIESRTIKGLDFDIFLYKLEKHIKIEIENYY